jgi:hypothetical protein
MTLLQQKIGFLGKNGHKYNFWQKIAIFGEILANFNGKIDIISKSEK